MDDYKKELTRNFWKYQQTGFHGLKDYFDCPENSNYRPPVFKKQFADSNILIDPASTNEIRKSILNEIPINERHRWFGSMKSSQALAQSVFGNLKANGYLHYLEDLTDDSGLFLFGPTQLQPENFIMEFSVDYLGEPRSTSIDVMALGDYRIAIECKFSEDEVGPCSRPNLKTTASNYPKAFCNGNYSEQRGRFSKCSLTEIGVLYWEFIPVLFKWRNDITHNPCPLLKNYQLVRNILAACIQNDNGRISTCKGHVVLVYDERNPAFQEGGSGATAFQETKQSLINPTLIRKCSWQRIIEHIRKKDGFDWLTSRLQLKYGL